MCLACPRLYTQKNVLKIFIKVTKEGITLKTSVSVVQTKLIKVYVIEQFFLASMTMTMTIIN